MHLFLSYAGSKSLDKIAFDSLKFSEANEQQRIKHSQRSKLFITIQFIPLKGCAVFPWKPPNFVILPAAHKQGFPDYYRILVMWPWPRPFIWSSWTIVLTPDMPILCHHVQGYTLGRLSIDGFSFERVAQFNLEWIFSKLDSGFQSLVGFRILSAGFRIPKPRIPDSTSKKFLDSGIRIPLHGAIITSEISLSSQCKPEIKMNN